MDIRNATPEQRAELNKLILGALWTEHRKTKLNNADKLKAWDITTRKDYQKFVVIWNGGEISCDYDGCIEYKAGRDKHCYRVASNYHGACNGYIRGSESKIDYVGLLIAQRTGEYTMQSRTYWSRREKKYLRYTTCTADNALNTRHNDNGHALYALQRARKDVKGDIDWDERRLKDCEKDIQKALRDLQRAYEEQAELKLSLEKRKAKMEDDIEKANADIREFMQKVRRGEKIDYSNYWWY